MFTDSHCHISKEYYENINIVIKEARENKINRLILGGCDHESNIEIIELVDKYDCLYGTLGIHPNVVQNATDKWFDLLESNITNNKIIAIGEIGLDYHYGKEYIELQKIQFENQLKIAKENNLPVVIHSRDATKDTIDILKKYNVKGIIHSFSGSYETAKIYIDMGFKLGINGTVTFKNSKLKEVLLKIALDDIVLETDCPYLTPEPYRGKINYPKYTFEIAKFIANLYETTLEEVSEKTEKNIEQIFDI